VAWLPPPSFSEVTRTVETSARQWWRREATRAALRLASVGAIIVGLGVIGWSFIALTIFPDRSTAVASNEQPCVYDAGPAQSDRYSPPPRPAPFVAGQLAGVELSVLNRGTCSWDTRLTLQRQGGSLPTAPLVVSVTQETLPDAFLQVQIPFTAPLTVGVYDSIWRMRAPDGQPFGAPIRFSIITYPEGAAPVYPAESPLTLGGLVKFFALMLPGMLGLMVALERAGRFMREFYGLKKDRSGRAYLIYRLFGVGERARITVADGEAKFEAEDEAIDKIGGPGLLSVHSDMAAVLERGGAYSGMVGPNKIILFPFERVRAVIDLRRLKRTKTESAYTKDGIEVKADTSASFELVQRMEGEQVPEPEKHMSWVKLFRSWLGFRVKRPKQLRPLPASAEAIRLILYELPVPVKWDSAVSSDFGEEIPKRMLDELWAPEDREYNPRRELVLEMFNKQRASLRKRGVELIDLTIGPLKVPPEVDKQLRDYWQMVWESRSRVTQAAGEAQALRQAQTARAEAQAELIHAIAQSFRMMAASGASQPSQVIAEKMIEVIARTMKVTLEDAIQPIGPADKALLLLDRLHDIVNPSG